MNDYHSIENETIHSALLFLLEHLPKKLHLIISTRVDPPWPLARFLARNQLVEIRARDLRFSVEEAAEFFNHTMGLNLSAEDLAALEAHTEGWIASLQLAAMAMQSPLSLQGRSDLAGFVRAFTGSNVYVAEYLLEEVLKQQPEDVQRFLLQTSILERLNAGLCEAVTGCQDGQAVLMALQRANIFVFPLDDQGRWFRYHPMFADLLQSLYEPFGIVCTEAMSMAKPTVVGARGTNGMREQIIPSGEKQCGVHVNPFEPKDIAWGLVQVLQSPDNAVQWGKNGRQRVLDEFSWDAVNRRTLDIYKEFSRSVFY